jgi:hypothetical protein
MESWNFGAILALTGFLVTGCSAYSSTMEIPLFVAGAIVAVGGSVIFTTKFKKWIEKVVNE